MRRDFLQSPTFRARTRAALLAVALVVLPAGRVWAAAPPSVTIVVPLAGVATWAELLHAQAAADAAHAGKARQPFQPPPLMPAWETQQIDALPGLVPPVPAAPAAAGADRLNAPFVPVRGFEAIHSRQNPAVFVTPPDTMGAAGPEHVMALLNGGVRIQTKNGVDLGFVALETFFSPGTDSDDVFDPRLIYDSLAGRWIAAADADRFSPSSQVLFAISATSDPTGSWSFYSFIADPDGLLWADFPGFGVNSTWIAITNNMFPNVDGPLQGSKMWVIDKATALDGGAITVTVFPLGFDILVFPAISVRGLALQPAVTFDADEPNLYIIDNSNFLAAGMPVARLSQISGTGPAPVWSAVPSPTQGLFFAPIPYNPVPFQTLGAEQLGVPSTCDGGAADGQPCRYIVDCPGGGGCRRITTADARVLSLSVFRNGHLWYVNHGSLPAVGTPDRVAVFWNQLDPDALATGSPAVQFGVLDGGPGVYHFFPSITVNKNDDVCIGFSRSDASRCIDGVEASRLGTDPPGTVRPIGLVKAGQDSYEVVLGPSGNRWGDYSATVIDPTDDESFWTIQEFAAQDDPGGLPGSWSTWWALKSRVSASAPILSPLGLLAAVIALLAGGLLLIRRRAHQRTSNGDAIDRSVR